MQALETLKQVSVSNQPYEFLWGLGQLTNLRNLVLVLPHPEADSDNKDTNVVGEDYNKDILSSLCKLGTKNLSSMTIWNGSSLLLEDLCLLNLKKLISCSSTVQRVPKWVKSLRNLQELRLELEGVKQDDLCILGALPALLILYLEVVTKSNERLRISGEIGFRFLRYFIYEVSYQPVDLMFAEGSMPKLEKLELKVLRVAEADSLEFGIKNLPCLSIVKCEVICDDDDYGDVETAMERATSTHPNHPTLLFSSLGW
jgi:disease resistance protein RPM1